MSPTPAALDAVVTGSLAEFSARLDAERLSGRTVGVVLTMGALHAGHASLLRRAAEECDAVALSVFVNPTQFAEATDLDRYPRTLEADLTVARDAGCGLVLAPSVEEMYPDGAPTTVTVGALAARWEGASRPGHFDGVATVVTKLLSATGRCRAYFGEKDFQQLAVVRRVIRDLSLPVEVVGCATVREADGLAMSSRNVRLSAVERAAAVCLPRALAAGSASYRSGGDARAAEAAMAEVVAAEPLVALDYAALVDAGDLEPVGAATDAPTRLLIAARVGPVRLIDNCDPRTGP